MTSSSATRRSGTVVALAVALATLATEATTPARADDSSCTTTTTLTVSGTAIVYGDHSSLRGEAFVGSCAGGTAPSHIGDGAGSTYIERSVDGRTWQRVSVGADPDYVSWSGEGIVSATAYYRARYTGGTESTTEPDTFSGSVSTPVRIDVIRDLSVQDESTRVRSIGRFELTPATGLVGRRLALQVRKGGKWRRYRTVRVNGRGGFRATFLSR